MSLTDRLKRDAAAFKAERETPPGRRLELRLISADCNILTVGCVGLAIWFPPLIYASAIGHLAVGFVKRRNTLNLTWFLFVGLIFSLVTVALTSSLVFVGTYVVQHFYFGVPTVAVADELRTNWMLYVAIAIVMGGIISVLFAHPGGAAQLVDYMDRAETNA